MRHTISSGWSLAAAVVVLAGMLAWPTASAAQNRGPFRSPTTTMTAATDGTVVGYAKAVQSTVLGVTTVLADTGTLDGTSDGRQASSLTGSVPSVLSGEVLRAVTIGWSDQVVSQASLANVSMTVGGTGISADFVGASAKAVLGAAGRASSLIDNLSVNGVPIAVTGLPNQTISIPGGQLVINEQTVSPAGTTVNALHATIFGVADVVIASATAGIQ